MTKNVKYNEMTTTEVAMTLGVDRCTILYWCEQGFIRFQDISSPGSTQQRLVFDVEEVNRVAKLRDQYGRGWTRHNDISVPAPVAKTAEVTTYGVTNPEEYITDDIDETVDCIKKIRALKIQRDKLLAELDSIDEAIKSMKQKVIEAI